MLKIGKMVVNLVVLTLFTPNSSIVKSPIKFMFLCACVNYIYKLIPIKSAIEIPLNIAIFNAIF